MPRRTVSPLRCCLAFLFSIGAILATAGPAIAQATRPAAAEVSQAYLREFYTKYEYMIPMRDGVKLYTAIYAPKDQAKRYPILLSRTPYGVKPYGEDVYPDPPFPIKQYAREQFIFALQDVRGRNASQGQFVHMRPERPANAGPKDTDESTDAYDTIDWLVKNVPNNNEKVGMMGISYPGFYTAAGMIDSHPALKCASPQAPIADWFIGDDFHENGTFSLVHAFGFLSSFGQKLEEPTREGPKRFDYKTPDGYDFYLNLGPLANADAKFFKGRIEYWDEMMSHGNDDAFWQARNLRPHLKNIKAAVMTVGGWYDAEDLFGALNTYRAVEQQNPGAANMLVMGPWYHGQWSRDDGTHVGNVNFAAKTGEFYREKIELPFLNHYLKDDANFDMPKAWVFETGTNQWRRYDAWPPKTSRQRQLYFRAGSRLSFDPPAAGEADFDEYVSDPAKPVPYIPNIAINMTREHMTDDQRFAGSRPDVLVYQTDVLDRDITLAGPIAAKLTVSTSGTDSDFVVKLIDVYSGDFPNPDPNPIGIIMGGYQQLVRGAAMRGKFRDSFQTPTPFDPGKPARVEWVLSDVCHTFRRGHRIMVQVQSSWFPLVDRNPQTFCDIYHARPEDFQKATERVYHAAKMPSGLVVGEMN
ncbi:MAG TPA: CocE/NonD family hydrolase [Tepidisphaeraceae bacterium]|nr:CocE/NonD family hydrolase [Tepidisphaeraceae bacterium]